MMNNILVTLALCFFCVCDITGQPFYFRHYEVEEGLSNNTVIAALQDTYGFMWFGTSDGLNRFDGNTFRVYKHSAQDPNSIGSNSVYCLHKDNNNNLWIGTEKGIYLYEAAHDGFSQLKHTPKEVVRGICSDNEGLLWFVLKDELYYYNIVSGILRKKHLPALANITSLANNLNGGIWIGTSNGKIASLKNNVLYIYDVSQEYQNNIETILHYATMKLFIGSSKEGAFIFDSERKSVSPVLNYSNTHKNIFTRNILQASDSSFFISTESGLYIYYPRTNHFRHLKKEVSNPFSLSDNALYALCKDKEGGIWIGSYFGGINYLPNEQLVFEKYTPTLKPNSLSGHAIREIVKDDQGDLWIGSEDGGLTKYNETANTFTKYHPDAKNNLASSNIHGLLAVKNKLLIGSFEHGLDIMDISTGKVTQHYHAGKEAGALKSNFVNKIFKTSNNRILLCTARGLLQFDINKGRFHLLDKFPANAFYSAVTEDGSGNVWIGTHHKGLLYTSPQGTGELKILYQDRNILKDTRIVYLMNDPDNNLWICTTDGLYCVNLENSAFRQYNTENGLPSDIVYSIIQDNNKNYWIPTSQGLVYMDYNTRKTKILTSVNGLLNNQFNYQSVFKDAAGYIYMGSIKGLIRFNPQADRSNNYIPPIYITDIEQPGINLQTKENIKLNEPTFNLKSLQLPYYQSSFSIGFAALHFTDPFNIAYGYKINNSEWFNIGSDRRISFTDLPPGEYDISIRSTDGSGEWTSNVRTLKINMLPPWWKSEMAYIIYCTLAGLAIYILVRLYTNRQKEKNRYKMQLFTFNKEKELFQSKMDFFTNITHEIKTPLTLIKVPLGKIMDSAKDLPHLQRHLQIMNSNTERLFELTNQLLDFRKIESEQYRLHLVKTDIINIVEGIWQRFLPALEQKKIRYSFSTVQTPVYVMADPDGLTKIISNLIHNAVKYCHSEIKLTLDEKAMPGQIILRFMNDGDTVHEEQRSRIFEPFYRYGNNSAAVGSGIGLALVQSLTQLHSGSIIYNVEDNLNTFVLMFPIAQ